MQARSFSLAKLAVAVFAATTIVSASHVNVVRDEISARHNTQPQKDEHGCQSHEYYYKKARCCVPNKGPGSDPKPPADIDCPSSYWWRAGTDIYEDDDGHELHKRTNNQNNGACVPRGQDSPPKPSCKSNRYKWNDRENCCKPDGPSNPTPSGSYNHHKRTAKRDDTMCPLKLTACPVSSIETGGDFECIDTESDLESCGGCPSLGQGQNCAAIKGAWNFACERSECRVYACEAGYKVSADSKSCVALD